MCVGLREAVAKSAAEDIGCLRARELGESLRELRRCIDGLEADFSRRLARFNDLRGYELDGAVDSVAWLRSNARLTSGAAAERVNVAQKLDGLGATKVALSRGEIGFAHAAVIARAVDDVSPEAAPQMETLALEVAKGTDPSSLRHFTRQARALIDPVRLLEDANRAHERRRLSLNEDRDGLFVLDGLLDPEGGLTLKTALEAQMGPKAKDDRRSAVQRPGRCAD
jgi:hypothetical protein